MLWRVIEIWGKTTHFIKLVKICIHRLVRDCAQPCEVQLSTEQAHLIAQDPRNTYTNGHSIRMAPSHLDICLCVCQDQSMIIRKCFPKFGGHVDVFITRRLSLEDVYQHCLDKTINGWWTPDDHTFLSLLDSPKPWLLIWSCSLYGH